MKKYKFLILFILTIPLYLSAQHFLAEERKILELQDIRSLGENKELISYLKSDNEKILSRTLTALANIADTATINKISKVLQNNTNPLIRVKAAFALGMINNHLSAKALEEALRKENDENVVCSILDALGRTGDQTALDVVCSYIHKSDKTDTALAVSIARFGMRKITSPKAFKILEELIKSDNQAAVRCAVYALSRIGDRNSLASLKERIKALTESENELISMQAYTALGRTKDSTEIKFILDRFNKTDNWKIKTAMLNAVSNLKYSDELEIEDSYIEKFYNYDLLTGNEHVIYSSFNALKNLFGNLADNHRIKLKINQDLKFIFNPSRICTLSNNSILVINPRIQSQGVLTLSYLLKDEIKSQLFNLLCKSDSYDVKAAIISSFRYFNDPMVYRELRDSISAIVQRYEPGKDYKKGAMIGSEDLAKLYKAFTETLTDLDDKMDDENRNIVRLIFTEFAASKNLGIVVTCLTNLTDTIYKKYNDETSMVLLFDYNELKYPEDLEVMQMFCWAFGELKSNNAAEILKKNLNSPSYDLAQTSAEALQKIIGKDFSKRIKAPKHKTDFDWNYMEMMIDTKYAILKTIYGDIKIELLPDIAPFSVQNFMKLAEKKYFDGMIFHRVVPNFVIQTGDPTGTGYSGPGWSLRSEFSDLTYCEYAVGMASSGKDTEGSQFFITHSPQPHLDGRYTIFGKVIEGMEAADKIQLGDKIESITLTNK